ncbi:MAG TPA: YncE family protein [Bacteroidales bacterium]|nr:YncE family protein [Bacteroidales bacterium]
MKKLLFFCACIILISCKKNTDEIKLDSRYGKGVFIVNEGTFQRANGSLSFFSYDSLKIYNDLFEAVNGRPLGDVPNSMISYGGKGYIIINNSAKIEVIDINTLESQATITGLISPRNMAVLNEGKAYVTSLYSDSVAIVDLAANAVTGYINLGTTSEAIAVNGNTAYISNWFGGNQVFAVNTQLDKVIDTINVGLEPESMVIDKYNRMWVLSTGGWRKTQKAEIDIIELINNSVEKKYVFPAVEDSPSCLKIDEPGQIIYYINKGVFSMDVNSESLPVVPLISEDNQAFYKIEINPVNSDILITDVIDYAQNGNFIIYKKDGTFISKHKAGLIPGAICPNFSVRTANTN